LEEYKAESRISCACVDYKMGKKFTPLTPVLVTWEKGILRRNDGNNEETIPKES